MELDVDISDVNAVAMRNVPPTPANYAQRSGGAGRSGQQALVLTYCSTGNARDSYWFRRSRDIGRRGSPRPPRPRTVQDGGGNTSCGNPNGCLGVPWKIDPSLATVEQLVGGRRRGRPQRPQPDRSLNADGTTVEPPVNPLADRCRCAPLVVPGCSPAEAVHSERAGTTPPR